MENTIFALKYSTCSAIGPFRKSQASKVDHHPTTHHHLGIKYKIKYNRFSVPPQNLGSIFQNDTTRNMNMAVYASTQPGPPLPADPSHGQWKFWIIGTIFTILMSFSRGKWGPLLQLKEKVETRIDEAEKVAGIVEEVADEVEKVAEEVVKHLPEGKLHDAVEFVEKVADELGEHAQKAEDALQKVEDMEKEFESFVESTIIHEEKSVVTSTESKDLK